MASTGKTTLNPAPTKESPNDSKSPNDTVHFLKKKESPNDSEPPNDTVEYNSKMVVIDIDENSRGAPNLSDDRKNLRSLSNFPIRCLLPVGGATDGPPYLGIIASYLTWNNVAGFCSWRAATVGTAYSCDHLDLPDTHLFAHHLFGPTLAHWRSAWLDRVIRPRFREHYLKLLSKIKNVSLPKPEQEVKKWNRAKLLDGLEKPWKNFCDHDERVVAELIIYAFENNRKNYKEFLANMKHGILVDNTNNNSNSITNTGNTSNEYEEKMDEKMDYTRFRGEFSENRDYNEGDEKSDGGRRRGRYTI